MDLQFSDDKTRLEQQIAVLTTQRDEAVDKWKKHEPHPAEVQRQQKVQEQISAGLREEDRLRRERNDARTECARQKAELKKADDENWTLKKGAQVLCVIVLLSARLAVPVHVSCIYAGLLCSGSATR